MSAGQVYYEDIELDLAALDNLVNECRSRAAQLKFSYAYGVDEIWEQEAPLRKYETLLEFAQKLEDRKNAILESLRLRANQGD